jgi:hypothetical protein
MWSVRRSDRLGLLELLGIRRVRFNISSRGCTAERELDIDALFHLDRRAAVLQTLEPGVWVPVVARRRSVNADQLFIWRCQG